MREVTVGFDIGISSVGWSIIDVNNGQIVESGVRLFSAASAEKNVDRRNSRQARRLIRRRRTRLDDLNRLFAKHSLEHELSVHNNPYELRVKGLQDRLEKIELTSALYHLAKRRGISYDLGDAEAEEEKASTSYKNSLNKNQLLLKDQTPGQIQLDRLKQFGKVRGQISVEEKEEVYLNIFPTSAYEDEAKRILEKQQTFYPEITDAFIEEYLAILTRKREYFVGPGNAKNRTDYGIYRTNGKTLDNLFEILIGKDKIYPEEYRAAGNSYTAQLFNLVNDLNNLTIDSSEDGKLTTTQKEKIIQEVTASNSNTNSKKMMKLIAKVANTTEDGIKRYRVDRSGQPEIHSFASFIKAKNALLKNDIDILEWSVELLDELGRILTLNTENGEIRKQIVKDLQSVYPILTDEVIDLIIAAKNSFSVAGNNKWHRFSLRTMKELLPEMLATNKEQMTILSERGMLKQDHRNYQEVDKLDPKIISEEIYNPVVGKSVREAIKLFNQIIQLYPHISYVVIEMPREANEDEARKNYQKYQKENEKEQRDSIKEFQEKSGISDSQLENEFRRKRKLRAKIRLWYQQQGKCFYSGKNIAPEDLLSSPEAFEIDHIIPQAVSFDDSLHNKVLCLSAMNQEKGKQTPYGFLLRGKGQGVASFKAMVSNNRRLSPAKKNNLLFDEDLNDIETRKRFVARNLVDTRYASRVVLNELQRFISAKEMDTKVTVVRGKFTATLRKHWRVNKSRETHHHHALDASIIAVSPLLSFWKKNATLIPEKLTENELALDFNEIIEDEKFEKSFYQLPKENFIEQLHFSKEKLKFSHQVDKKMNRKVSNATIYTTRKAQVGKDKDPQDYVLSKIKDIYTVDGYKNFKTTYAKGKDKFLMFHLDPRSFTQLEDIMKQYPESKEELQDNGKIKEIKISPFQMYREDQGDYIRKYSKKGNGPIIRQLKYYDKALGSHINITPTDAKNKTVALQSLKPWRTDVYFNPQTNMYEIMGIKYSDLRFSKGNYGIPKERYKQLMANEDISKESEFYFSLYRNDRVKIIDSTSNEQIELLFGSRSNAKGYVEMKPIDKSRFKKKESLSLYGMTDVNGRFSKRFAKENYVLFKVNTDIMGNPFYVKKEGESPKNILD